MNFGDILDEWERYTARPRGKGRGGRSSPALAAAPLARRNPPQEKHPLTVWLETHEVHDKDASLETSVERPWERRRRLMHARADAVIDLHGLNREEAWKALEHFFGYSKRQGLEKLLIVHGKGNHSGSPSVLTQLVKTFIERCPFAGESGHGQAAVGGTGVTWVLLKITGKNASH